MPTKSRLAAAALGATAVATIPAAVFASSYIVRPGDTAPDIAVRHGTTVAALLDANRMAAPELIRVGQMLQIPDASMTLPAYTRGAADSETHRVGRGEGVFEIARRFGVDPTALRYVQQGLEEAYLAKLDPAHAPAILNAIGVLSNRPPGIDVSGRVAFDRHDHKVADRVTPAKILNLAPAAAQRRCDSSANAS